MCGIVGYLGPKPVKEILLTGLLRLEYRGYDSAGIAMINEDGVHLFKEKGRLANLETQIDKQVVAHVGIGHTRWATHGPPNKKNAHPHQSQTGRFTIVHNGVIENERQLRTTYLADYPFISDTDTEVIAGLLEKWTKEACVATVIRRLISELHGSYALGIIDNTNPEVIYAVKNKSPLLLGLGDGFNLIGSDAMAMLHETDEFVEIYDKEYIELTKSSATIFDQDGNVVTRDSYIAEIDASDIEKGAYAHYMLKEIDEQPAVIRRILSAYVKEGALEIEPATLQTLKQAKRIYLVAAGTSMHASLIGKQWFENITGIPTEVHIASEFAYNTPLIAEGALFVFLSQSGETADSRAVLVKIKALGYPSLTLTNVPGSTLSREATHALLIHAGPEISVASTKAYIGMLAVLFILTTKLAEVTDLDVTYELGKAATVIDGMISNKDVYHQLAKRYFTKRNAFYIGRHVDYYTAVEAALKLKEVSYIQTEGFAAEELKHGTIALIEANTPVIGIVSQETINLNTRSNLKEVAARGAKTLVITLESLKEEGDQIVIPDVHPLVAPLVTIVPTQLLAYYAALELGLDIDKPRNLAKSVTVE